MGKLDGRVALVTGGARGIGAAITAAYHDEGATVSIVDLDAAAAEAMATRISAGDGRCAGYGGDVADESAIGRIVGAIEDQVGTIDILVNNAAVQREGALLDQTLEDFRLVVDTNLLGTFVCSRAVLPGMLRRGRGVIINLSSVLGLTGDALLPVYSATKHAIIGLTRSTTAAYARYGIRCVAICPGDVDTELNKRYFESQPDPVAFRQRVEREYPGRRIAEPDEIARVAVFLASDDASFVNGTYVLADGGIMSRLFDLYEPAPVAAH
jgi:NAD(P)-dependent dehydrogenase (short-subunit alcohol dehydrogenase family)